MELALLYQAAAYRYGKSMHTQTILNKMYVCKTCGEVILFESDKDEHTRQTGHFSFEINNLTPLGI